MPIHFVDLPPDASEIRCTEPASDEHCASDLLFYLSRTGARPTLGISVPSADTVVVTRNHQYYWAAFRQRWPFVRCLVQNGKLEHLTSVAERYGTRVLEMPQVRAEEDALAMHGSWHVFTFEKSLSAEEQALFENGIAALLRRGDPGARTSWEQDAQVAAIFAITPLVEDWMNDFLRVLFVLARQVKIRAYQGKSLIIPTEQA